MQSRTFSFISALIGILSTSAGKLHAEDIECENKEVTVDEVESIRFQCIQPAMLAAYIKEQKGSGLPLVIPNKDMAVADNKTCEPGLIRIIKVESAATDEPEPVEPEFSEL